MGWFDDDHSCTQAYNDYQNAPNHQASLSHELIAGAATYEASKAYENHVAQNGQPANHAEAKEVMSGFAGAFVDREVETKGLDYIDSERAKNQARQQCNQAVDQYGGYDNSGY